MSSKIRKVILIIFVAGGLIFLLYFIYSRIENKYLAIASSNKTKEFVLPNQFLERGKDNNNTDVGVDKETELFEKTESLIESEINVSRKISDNEEVEVIQNSVDLSGVVVEKNNILGVKEVIDGDTIVLSTGDKVRYIGIDTPELNKKGGVDDECLAWSARLKNMELLNGGNLELVSDSGADKDTYGRLLRYVYANGVFVNAELAKLGMAREFFCQPGWENCPVMNDQNRKKIILDSVAEAKERSLGIYSKNCQK